MATRFPKCLKLVLRLEMSISHGNFTLYELHFLCHSRAKCGIIIWHMSSVHLPSLETKCSIHLKLCCSNQKMPPLNNPLEEWFGPALIAEQDYYLGSVNN